MLSGGGNALRAFPVQALPEPGGAEELNARRVMLIAGSTTGSTESLERSFLKAHNTRSTVGQPSTTMFMSMNHSVALTSGGDVFTWGEGERGCYPHAAPVTGAHIVKLFSMGCYDTNHVFRVDKGFVAQVQSVLGECARGRAGARRSA